MTIVLKMSHPKLQKVFLKKALRYTVESPLSLLLMITEIQIQRFWQKIIFISIYNPLYLFHIP